MAGDGDDSDGGGGGGGLEVTRAGVGKNGVSAPPVHQSGIN